MISINKGIVLVGTLHEAFPLVSHSTNRKWARRIGKRIRYLESTDGLTNAVAKQVITKSLKKTIQLLESLRRNCNNLGGLFSVL